MTIGRNSLILFIIRNKWKLLVPVICIILFFAIYLDARNETGVIHINGPMLNAKNLDALRNNYHKLGESGDYQVTEPAGDNPFVLLVYRGKEDKAINIYIYMNSLDIFDSDRFEYTANYKRSTIISALYGIEPLGRHNAFFELKSNFVYMWIADYDDGSALSIENELNKLMSMADT